jgi:hypothetical protein
VNIVTLFERDELKRQFLTPEFQRALAGDLFFPEPHNSRPYVTGNFCFSDGFSGTFDLETI